MNDKNEQSTSGDGLVDEEKLPPLTSAGPPGDDPSAKLDVETIQDALFPHGKMEEDLRKALQKNPDLLGGRPPQAKGWIVPPKFIGLVAAGLVLALGYGANGSVSTAWGIIALITGFGVYLWMAYLESRS